MTKEPWTPPAIDTGKPHRNESLEKRIVESYLEIPEWIRDDIVEAAIWTRDTLRDHEGTGHCIHVSANSERQLCCSFAKPQWSGDHCGRYMESASEAMVMAVCEYLAGA